MAAKRRLKMSKQITKTELRQSRVLLRARMLFAIHPSQRILSVGLERLVDKFLEKRDGNRKNGPSANCLNDF